MCSGIQSRNETSADKWQKETQGTSGKQILTDKWQNELQQKFILEALQAKC